jgi:hypothetical protein
MFCIVQVYLLFLGGLFLNSLSKIYYYPFSEYTPPTIFGSPVVDSSSATFVEQAQELNIGLTFTNGQWNPAQ